MLRRLFFTFAATVFLIAAGDAKEAMGPAHPVVSYQLDNGLRVVLSPDPTVPKVVTNVRYRVGSMNEPSGRSGFAHLFEHLMFSGTKSWPNVFGAHSANGNTINAYTFEDGTVYWAEGISANLPMMLSLEADRMANLGGEVDQSELDLQRSVVKNEMRQNVLDKPAGAGWEAIWGALFPKNHPYSRSVIGSIPDLDAATLDDVKGFFNTYYVPNNAVLVVVGDFEIANARALIDDTFGRIPRGEDVPWPDAPDTEPTKVRLELEDRLPSDIVAFAYSGPRDGAPMNGALEIAAELMGNAEFGFLRQKLVVDEPLANAVSAGWWEGLLAGRFTIDATARDGVSSEQLEARLREAVAEFIERPIDPADLERARSTLLRNARLGIESYNDRADRIVYAAIVHGNGERALVDDPQIVAATADDVREAMRAVLDPAKASVLAITPGKRGGYPAVLTESSGEAEPFDVAARPVVDVPVLSATQPRTAQVPVREEATLSNGAKVVHYHRPGAPMAYVAAQAAGGWTSTPPDRPGLISMALRMAYRGAGGMDYPTFAKAAKDIGADVSYSADDMASAVTLSVPGENLGKGLAMLSKAVRDPNFDPAEWELNVNEMVDSLLWRASQIDEIALRAGENLLMPATATMPRYNWDMDLLRQMTVEEARQVYAQLFQPQTTTFYSVGPSSLDELVTALEGAFGDWAKTGDGFKSLPAQPATFEPGRNVLVVPEPGASQSGIYVFRPAPGSLDAERAASLAVVRLLAVDFTGRLNSVIREEKGYSYGVGGGLYSGMQHGGIGYASATVERDNTGAALAEFFNGFDSLKTVPVSPEELARTHTIYRGALASAAETGSGLFDRVVSNAGTGLSLEEYFARNTAMTELTLDNVQKAALDFAALDPGLIVISGDADHILPQLEAIGLTGVKVLETATSVDRAADAVLQAVTAVETGDGTDPAPGRTVETCRGAETLLTGPCAAGDELDRQD
ncbi:MAG: insulinase family protein [Brucellaceae bacterium]|nr:insulinase family protein [Brucellaceae bacterium]